MASTWRDSFAEYRKLHLRGSLGQVQRRYQGKDQFDLPCVSTVGNVGMIVITSSASIHVSPSIPMMATASKRSASTER